MTIDYRAAFDIPRDVCYLNACYMGPQPRAVLEATIGGARKRANAWEITPADFFSDIEVLRASFARQVSCSPENIAIVPSAGYGAACASRNLPVSKGGVILALDEQFPSNYYSWRRQALATGATFAVVSKEADETWAQALLEAIRIHGDSIEIATLEGHHWASAELIDLEVVIPALRQVGARVVLDLTQSIGAYPTNIAELAPDFMIASGYKWQFCPYGIGFLYVADEHLDGVPIEEAWMDRAGAEDFSRLVDFTDDYQSGARRFDMSEKSSFSNVAGAIAALQMLEDWGIPTIAATLAATNETIADILSGHGFEVMDAALRAPHFQGARLPDTDPRKLASRLLENKVFASVRGEYLRVAPHLYTDAVDLARFDDVLERFLAAG